MKRYILIILLFFTFASFMSIHAQWARTYGGPGDDSASFFQQTSDGGNIIAGETESFGAGLDDIWILKLSSYGDIEWQKTYGGINSDSISFFQQTSDGGYIIAGRSDSFGTGSYDYDIWILKLSSNGDIEWQKTYGEGGGGSVNFIQETSDGGYIIAGMTNSFGAGEEDIWIIKLSANGDIEWQKAYGGSSWEEVHSIQQTSDGGYIITSETHSFDSEGYDIWILKLDSNGDTEWQKTYGGDYHYQVEIFLLQESDGGYTIASETRMWGAGCIDILVLKLNSNGDLAWQKTYGGTYNDSVSFFQQTSDGGYIIAGETESFGAGLDDIWILKLNSSGDIEWQETYGGSSSDKVESVQQTSDGGYIITGKTSSFGARGYDVWILRLNSNRDIEWQKIYGGDYSCDHVLSVQQTSDGSYIVAGETRSWGLGMADIWILKLLTNGEINPGCAFVKTSDAEVSMTLTVPQYSYIIPVDTEIIPVDTEITPLNTDISPQDSDAAAYELCVSSTCTLVLSSSSGGTTDPAPGSYTYDTGTDVSLEAIPNSDPDTGCYFLEWTGNVQTTSQQITITMDGDKTINAIFSSPGGVPLWVIPGCFIATATYGSPIHPHVKTLRNFRDRYLVSNTPGREFVDLYYTYSPFAANAIAKHKPLKIIARIHLVPIIAFSYSMVHLGPIMTTVILMFIFTLPIIIFSLHRSQIKRIR